MRSVDMDGTGVLRKRAAFCMGCMLVLCAGWAAAAQEPPSEGDAPSPAEPRPRLTLETTISDKPTIIAAQVWSAYEIETKILREMQSSATLDSIQEYHETVHQGYALLRVATHGLENAIGKSKYPNPMLKMRHEKIWEIRGSLNSCMLRLDSAKQLQDMHYVETAIDDLEIAVALLKELVPRML
jgi:hypothetical protein